MNKEKRSERINLSLTYDQYKMLEVKAYNSDMKVIEFATKAVLDKRIFAINHEKFLQQMLRDYRTTNWFIKTCSS